MGVIGTPSGTITPVSAGGSPSLSYLGPGEYGTASITSRDYGNYTAPSAGLMIVLWLGRQDNTGRTVSSISIGGSNGTLTNIDIGATTDSAAVAYRQVSSGSNNVTVTMSAATGTNTRHCIAVWLLTGHLSDTPVLLDCNRQTSPLVIQNTVPPNMIQLFLASSFNTADQTLNSWTTSTIDEADNEIGTTGSHFGAAHYLNGSSPTNRTETVTFTSGTCNLLMAGWV